MSSTNPYELLEISPNATAEEVKSAYLRLAKKWHPDRFTGDEKPKAEERFRELNEAYSAVKDPVRRSSVPMPSAAPRVETPAPPAGQERTAKDWYDDAKAAFDKADAGRSLVLVQYAIRVDGSQGPFHILQGMALERLGESRKALKSYETAISLNPKDAETLLRMADLYQAQGMKARGDAMLQSARRIAPNHRRFKVAKGSADAKGKGGPLAPQGSLSDQAKALWGRLTGKG